MVHRCKRKRCNACRLKRERSQLKKAVSHHITPIHSCKGGGGLNHNRCGEIHKMVGITTFLYKMMHCYCIILQRCIKSHMHQIHHIKRGAIPGNSWKILEIWKGWNNAFNLILWRISQEYRKISTPPPFG